MTMLAAAADAAESLTVRDTTDADMPAIHDIYAYEVLNGLATFEEIPPSVEELCNRRASVLGLGLPYLTAEWDGKVVGYSYASFYRPRVAYRFTIENSVYVAQNQHRRGVGRALLAELIARCEAGPWRQMVAIIGDSANEKSIRLHEHMGFQMIGTMPDVGFKFNRWVDSVVMQRRLTPVEAAAD